MQVQTSALVGWFRGDRKRCISVHSPFFPPKKGEKNRKEPNRPENRQYFPKLAKTCSLEFRICLYLEQQISKILTQIQLENQGFKKNKSRNINTWSKLNVPIYAPAQIIEF